MEKGPLPGRTFLVSERKDKALQAWRERMRNNQSAQFKRVAKTSSPMTMNLFHSDQPDSVTTNVTQAFQMLKSFWVDVWKGHDLDEQATNAAWGEATYSLHCSPRTWPQLEIADFVKNVQKLSSSSAGLDGWSGTELSHLYVY